MNIHFQDLIPKDFNDNARVWIYQANRAFTVNESLEIEDLLQNFTKGWNSHGDKVSGFANLFFGHFIIFIADETNTAVSGCSTDSSVNLVKNIEKDYRVQLFDRQTLAFIVKERIQLLPLEDINFSLEDGFITPDSLYFNNTILSKSELINNWIIPVKQSWLASRLTTAD